MMHLTRRFSCAVLAITLPFSLNGQAAEDCAPIDPNQSISLGVDLITLNVVTGSASIAAAGGDIWNACPEAGVAMPNFTTSSGGQVQLNVHIVGGTSPTEGCGRSSVATNSSGQLVGGDIWIYDATPSGIQCNQQTQTMAHELGHFLGLIDNHSDDCLGRIMGDFVPGVPRSLAPEDCSRVDGRFLLPEEIPDTDPGDDDGPCAV